MKAISILTIILGALILAGCQTVKEAENISTLGVEFSWAGVKACSGTPPAFTISNVPDATDTLVFKMVDMDVPGYNHGGGTVKYTGSGEIPEGAFYYQGSCPPSGSHRYRFTVKAINAAGDTILGKGEQTHEFPPK